MHGEFCSQSKRTKHASGIAPDDGHAQTESVPRLSFLPHLHALESLYFSGATDFVPAARRLKLPSRADTRFVS